MGARITHHCFHLVFDGQLGSADSVAGSYEANFTLDLARTRGLGDIYLAARLRLHLTDSLTTLADDHAHSFGGDVNRVVDLITTTAGTTAHAHAAAHGGWTTISTVIITRGSVLLAASIDIPAVTVDNFHDVLLGLSSSFTRANQVDRSQAVDTLVLTHNVNVAPTSFLQVSNSFATTTNDQTNSTIRHHDLHAVFTLTQRTGHGGVSSSSTAAATLVESSAGNGTHTRVFNNSINGRLGFGAPGLRTTDSALTIRALVIRASNELYAASRLRLDTSQVLALSANDEAN